MLSIKTKFGGRRMLNMNDNIKCSLCDRELYVLFNDGRDFHYAPDSNEYFGVGYCTHCEIGFTFPNMSFDQLLSRYSNDYNAYLPIKGIMKILHNLKYHQDINKILKCIKRSRKHNDLNLFDIGAGGGHFLATCKKHGFDVEGAEMSPYGVAAAKNYYDINLLQKSAEDLKFDAGRQYDVITMNNVLEHLSEPFECLKNIFANGFKSTGGILFLRVPQIKSYTSEKFGKYFHGYSLPYHRTHFTEQGISRILTDIGYRNIICFREDLPFNYDRSMMKKPSESIYDSIYKHLPQIIRLPFAQLVLLRNINKPSDGMAVLAQKM